MKRSYLFTSESVSEGHPDKVCDRISDMVVDTYLSSGDPQTRVACETLTTTNKVVLAGEVRAHQSLKIRLYLKLEIVLKILVMNKMAFIGRIVMLKVFFMSNQLILLWVLILVTTKMRAQVIKESCLVLLVKILNH